MSDDATNGHGPPPGEKTVLWLKAAGWSVVPLERRPQPDVMWMGPGESLDPRQWFDDTEVVGTEDVFELAIVSGQAVRRKAGTGPIYRCRASSPATPVTTQ